MNNRGNHQQNTPQTMPEDTRGHNRLVDLSVLEFAVGELKKERELRLNLERQLAAQRGKVRFADAVTASGDSILVRELAGNLKQQGMDTGEKRLFAWLRENSYLYRLKSGYNMPTQKSLELGIIEIQKRTRISSAGKISVERTPMITAKGQEYFFQLLTAGRNGE